SSMPGEHFGEEGLSGRPLAPEPETGDRPQDRQAHQAPRQAGEAGTQRVDEDGPAHHSPPAEPIPQPPQHHPPDPHVHHPPPPPIPEVNSATPTRKALFRAKASPHCQSRPMALAM